MIFLPIWQHIFPNGHKIVQVGFGSVVNINDTGSERPRFVSLNKRSTSQARKGD